MFLSHLFIGCFMIAITVTIHAIATDRLLVLLEKIGPRMFHLFRRGWKIPMLIVTVLGVFLAHIIQIWIWAALYFYFEHDVLKNFETALYFSTVSFTTVGFGDIVLSPEWRLLSSFEAANGFILFGWSTAFIFEIISKLYEDDKIKKTGNER
ncbi:MAG: two pore domain potassium channel family protein [Alphaproteobacteria bacterium]|nr:two pore domain potassium channel family protein [Alphaproteobacteria bacterium]